jgi:UDP-glucose 4-epimerase
MRVLVTGGAGFIGSRLVDLIEKETDWQVTVFDNLSRGSRAYLSDKTELVVGDIRNREEVEAVIKGKEVVFHLAALISPVESIDNPALYIETNTLGTLNLLDAAVNNNVKKFVFASSAAVYGSVDDIVTEDRLYNPSNPYGMTKVDGELLVRYYRDRGVESTVLRFFNIYGERQVLSSGYAGVIPIFINKALKNETLTVFGDGEQTRDFIYIGDAVRAALSAVSASGVYNIGSGVEHSVNRLAEIILGLTGSKSRITHEPAGPGDNRRSLAGIEKARRELSWQPENMLEENLKKVIEWYKNI